MSSGMRCARSLNDPDARLAGAERADVARASEALAFEVLHDLLFRLGRASDEQSTARLRIGQELFLPFGKIGGKRDFGAVALPVPVGRAGRDALLRPFER